MLFLGNALKTLDLALFKGLKIQCCVTSPPYFGLRDYGNESQIGLEQTVEEYIDNLVKVFAKVRKIMADDGVLWVNIADSYAGSGKGRNADGTSAAAKDSKQASNQGTVQGLIQKAGLQNGCKPKDLIGVPWLLAFALRADGWYLRQDIIWNKPNAMPESVTDRCTKSHEYIFMLTKSKKYYFNNEAIKEPTTTHDALKRDRDKTKLNNTAGKTKSQGLQRNNYEKRNKRSVWNVTTKPLKHAHFAAFPIDLIEPCILASSRENDIVFDPFMGSGTTAIAASLHGRKWAGCELNEDYVKIMQQRLNKEFEVLK